MRWILATVATIAIATTAAVSPVRAASNDSTRRLNDAAAVLSATMSAPDKGIPQDLLQKAHCIVIVPDLKTAAFIVGGK